MTGGTHTTSDATLPRTLTDRLAGGSRRLFQTLDVPLEANWYVLMRLLERHTALSIAEVAIVLGISRPAVIEMAGNMEEAGLIAGGPDLFAEPNGFD